jgi:hypothetical protein
LVYNTLSKNVVKISDEHERKLTSSQDPITLSVRQFFRGINSIHDNLSKQLSKNTVALGSKTHKIAKSRKETVGEKL